MRTINRGSAGNSNNGNNNNNNRLFGFGVRCVQVLSVLVLAFILLLSLEKNPLNLTRSIRNLSMTQNNNHEASEEVPGSVPQTPPAIFVTGGAGFIGSHTCVELLNAGYSVVVADNLVNSNPESLKRVQKITNKTLVFYQGDMQDEKFLGNIFAKHSISAVIHFAALKAVGESVQYPIRYYENNLVITINLMKAMAKHNVKKIIFSSSATVYGDPPTVPISEDFPLQPTNPYGRTKLFIEEMLRDQSIADPSWTVILLRYFNPVGAHPSGEIGENPKGIPNNVLPVILQVATGHLPKLQIFGKDYNTPDGTGVRDYIHIVDLARGHIAALRFAVDPKNSGTHVFNLGTGKGCSVLELVRAIEEASGLKIPYEFAPRRPGDIGQCYADPSKANQVLGWKTEFGLKEMAADAWNWRLKNPEGY